MIKTDGTPTIAWDPRPLPADTPPIPDPPQPGPSVEREELDVIGALTLAP